MPDSLDQPSIVADGHFEKPARRTWPILILSLLLLIQAVGFFLLGGLYSLLIEFDWELTPQDYLINIPLGLRGAAYLGLGILSVVSAAGFFRMWAGAWLYATMVQGLGLLIALFLYFREKPVYIFIFMLYCTFMVIYLHHSEIMAAFRSDLFPKD